MKQKCKNCTLMCAKRKKELQRHKRVMIVGHVVLFIVVEILLLQGIFGEWPSIGLMSLMGIGHIVYYASIPFAVWMSTKQHHVRHMWYIFPFVVHVLIHMMPLWLYHYDQPKVRAFGMHHVRTHQHTDVLQVHSYGLLGLAIVVLIVGEYLLHRKRSTL